MPALRLRGLYLALVTLGLAIALPQLIKRFDGLTEGTQGLTVEQPTAPGWLPLEDDQFLYLLCLAIAAVMFLLAWNMMRGQLGRAVKAVRDGEIPASTLGVDLAATKTRVFAVSAAYAGVAGALYVFAIGFVAPEAFTLTVSFAFLAAIVVGGLATISGALFGALFIEFVPVYASDVNVALTGVIYGGVLIAFMWVLPEGAAGLPRRLRALAARRRSERRRAGHGGGRTTDPEGGSGMRLNVRIAWVAVLAAVALALAACGRDDEEGGGDPASTTTRSSSAAATPSAGPRPPTARSRSARRRTSSP